MEESRSFPFGKCPFIGYSSTASRSPFPHKGRLTRKPNSPKKPNLSHFLNITLSLLNSLVSTATNTPAVTRLAATVRMICAGS